MLTQTISIEPRDLLEILQQRNSIYPGKAYLPVTSEKRSERELAQELNAIWHGHGTALSAVGVLLGREYAWAISNTVGYSYLRNILKVSREEADQFSNSPCHESENVMLRQSFLFNEADHTELLNRWGKKIFKKAGNFVPDFRLFWEQYYDIFGGRRKEEIDFLVQHNVASLRSWLYIFESAAGWEGAGQIIITLQNDHICIK